MFTHVALVGNTNGGTLTGHQYFQPSPFFTGITMFGRNFPMAFTHRPEVGSASFVLVTFAADLGAREAPRASETAVQCI